MPYPPGVSSSTPNAPWNAADHSHEHELTSTGDPIFEDGAVIFNDYCEYSEGKYGNRWSCEEVFTYRCEVERVILFREDKPNISYLASQEDPKNEWRFIEALFENALQDVEQAFRNDNLKLVKVEPANEYCDGYVEVIVGNCAVVYTQ